MYRCAPPSSAHRTSRDGGGPLRRPALGLIAALLAVTVTACVGGPAANRAGVDEPPETGTSPTPDPSEDPTDHGNGPTEEPPAPSPSLTELAPPPAEGTADEVAFHPLDEVADPTAVAVLPGGDALVGSREGALYRVSTENGDVVQIGELPGVESSRGGLLSLTVEGEFLYAYYATGSDIRLSRYRQRSEDTVEKSATHLVTNIPAGATSHGGALAFGPDGFLYAAVGDGSSSESELTASLLRMDGLGKPPEGNIGEGSLVYARADTAIVGMAWDALGRIWTAEGDGNLKVDGTAVHELETAGRLGDLVYLDGSLWISEPGSTHLWRVPLDGTELAAQPQALSLDRGALHAVARSADELWVLAEGGVLQVSVS